MVQNFVYRSLGKAEWKDKTTLGKTIVAEIIGKVTLKRIVKETGGD
jgi:hypothetical protein